MPVHELKTKADLDKVLLSDSVSALMCKTLTCGPCKQAFPRFERMSEEFKNVKFYFFDYVDFMQFAHKLKIRAVPTFIFMYKEHVLDAVGNNENLIRNALSSLEMLDKFEKEEKKNFFKKSESEIKSEFKKLR